MIDPLVVFRVRRAWNKLSNEDKERLRPHIEEAHQDLRTIVTTGRSGPVKSKRELLYAQSSIESDLELFLKATEVALEHAAGLKVNPPLDANGDILGFGKFQILDPGWLEATAVWLEEFCTPLPEFKACTPVRIPNQFTMALLADWGTGAWGAGVSPSMKILQLLQNLQPDISVHLGDVYYAGTRGAERRNLADVWPKASCFAGTLNSNHEMYAKGWPYFEEALAADGPFSAQKASSVFLLENDFWVIVGLDTAYFSDPYSLYMNGVLDESQRQMLAYAGTSGKRVLVLSHHNGLCEDGSRAEASGELFDEVATALGNASHVWWYWGHVHCGAAYRTIAGPSSLVESGYHCRCIGHGSLPWGYAAALAGNPRVLWFESTPAGDSADTERVCNGFAVLKISNEELVEQILTENNVLSWTKTTPPETGRNDG